MEVGSRDPINEKKRVCNVSKGETKKTFRNRPERVLRSLEVYSVWDEGKVLRKLEGKQNKVKVWTDSGWKKPPRI